MIRIKFSKLFFVFIIILFSVFNTQCNNSTEGQTPNIIFIFSDGLSCRDLSAYGQQKFSTPNLDNLAQNTLLFFTSDNGPAGEGGGTAQHPGGRIQGTSGPYRGCKGSLYEGGIRVPGLLEWPAEIKGHRETDMPAVTSDYYPTILDILDIDMENQPKPVDGISLWPLIQGDQENRSSPIAFTFSNQQVYMNEEYKIYSSDGGDSFQLYNIREDPYEENDLAGDMPDQVNTMRENLNQWLESCKKSEQGNDY